MINRPQRTVIHKKSLSLMGVPYTFQNKTINDFLTYESEDLEKVKSFMCDYLNNLSDKFNNNQGLLLYGSNGVGKTLISSLIIKSAYINRFSGKRTTFVDYVSAYTHAWNAKSLEERDILEQDFYCYYKAVEFLVLEEVGKEIDSKVAAPILEDCLRYREDKGLVTIICTNLDIPVLKERYGASIVSLMRGNMTPILIEGEDKRESFYKNKVKGNRNET